ncbi:MAG: P-loop NTPase fold protein, partial [bacterium]
MAIRETFIQKVKGLIVENHGVSDGSFILGISARWGEGKTKFLDDLEIELGDEFLIVKLSPWKFGLDKTSFLRHFLTELNKKANRKVKLDRLYYDISENKPSFGWYMPLFFIILLILLLAVSFPTFFWLADTYNIISKFILDISKSKFVVNILYFKWVLTLLLIPFLLKIFTFQRSSNAITTLTDFDKFLEEILHNIKKKKIVVYVDDLDRVTPKIARDVLDDLRTFFDQKKITFIITGDHSVLEQYIGQEILPNNSPGEKTEEGRRYLKKIFNIYWRLLPPSNSDFSKFVDDEVEKRKDKLLEIFKETQVDIFKGYLSKYFEKNYRQVIRFIDYLIFYFDAIQSQINISDGDEKEFLSDLTNHPLLVVRILLLQDICNPLYEAVLKEPALLFSIEEYTDKQKMDLVDNQIKQRNIIM